MVRREGRHKKSSSGSLEEPRGREGGGGMARQHTTNSSSSRRRDGAEEEELMLVREDSESKAWSIMRDLDPWTAWLYKPRTITFLLVGACLLVGVLATIAVFLGYCLLQAPPTILVRPHPSFWRLIHGIAVVYLVFLTFLLFQKRDDARRFLKFLHPELGVELKERSYGADCRIYTPENPTNKFANVWETLFDEFVIAHTLGWWGKAIMVRNLPLLWVLSIGFELMEVGPPTMMLHSPSSSPGSLAGHGDPKHYGHKGGKARHWPCMKILSLKVQLGESSCAGIWAGMRTVRYFDGKAYAWVGLSRQPSIMDKVKRSLGQFTPAYWDKDEWNPLMGPTRFVQVLVLAMWILTVEVNAFFLKLCLWIPPRNPLNSYRLLIWWLIANPAIREYNSFLQTRKPTKKLGAFCWLALAIAIVETLICVKFGQGLYPKPMPRWIVWSWITAGVGLLLFLSGWTYKLYTMKQGTQPATHAVDAKKNA